jgi:hypothetical protein
MHDHSPRLRTARASPEDPRALLRCHLGDSTAAWSVGTWGGVGEFRFDRDEPCEIDLDALTVVTARGALRATPVDAAVAFEIRDAAADKLEEIAFCLPADRCGPARPTTLTELGADADSLRAADRRDILFDLGLGAAHIDVLVRLPVADMGVLSNLRAACGHTLFDGRHGGAEALRRANPPRIFRSRLARLEVYEPIPPPGGKSPDGPHSHILPALLRQRRAHAPDSPIPDGWFCCLSLHFAAVE